MKASNAVGNGNVLVTIEAVTPRNAQAPTGSGLRTRPEMVEIKMARSCHDWGVSSGGLGTAKRRIRPTEIEMISGIGLAPFGGRFSTGIAAGVAAEFKGLRGIGFDFGFGERGNGFGVEVREIEWE